MKNRINIVSEILCTRLNDITTYQHNFNGTITIESQSWKPLDFYPGSAIFNIENSLQAAGSLYVTSITGRLKQTYIFKCPVLLKVVLCNGDSFLIGSKSHPVFIESMVSLTTKSFKISHRNSYFPLKIT